MKSILIKDTTKEEREIKEINAEYMSQYRQDRQIH